MKYAIIEIQGKQFKVKDGDIITVDSVEAEEGQTLSYDSVLFLKDGEDVKVGTPFVEKSGFEAKVVEHLRGKKIRVAKFKAKSRYRKVQGHRQSLSKVQITLGSSKPAKKKEAAEKSA